MGCYSWLQVMLCILFATVTVSKAVLRIDNEMAFTLCSNHPMCRDLYRQAEYVTPKFFEQQAKVFMDGSFVILSTASILTNAEQTLSLAETSSGSHGNISATLYRETLIEMEKKLVIARLIIGKLALDERRCPPNMYWQWDPITNSGRCTCFFDRDCDIEALELCHDNAHSILLATMIVVGVLILINIIVRMIYDPDLYKTKNK